MLHLFDVDHTIVKTSTVKDFLLAGMVRGIIPLRLVFHVPRYFLLFTLSKVGSDHADSTLQCLKNITREDMDILAAGVFDQTLRNRLDSEVVSLIREIRGRNERIVLASSSFRTILTPLANYLGLEEMITNELEFSRGVSTGRLTGLPVFQDGKKTRVLDFLKKQHIDPKDCTFYSDSPRDLPLLESIGHPVAVNPKKKLRRIANARGWDILDTPVSGGDEKPC